jgi:hypothetical protein
LDLSSNIYSQTTVSDLNGSDSSQVFSWQNISLPAGGILTRGVIAKFGDFESAQPSLTLSFVGTESPLYHRSVVTASGTVTGGPADLRLVIDGDLTQLFSVASEANGLFEFNFTAVEFNVGEGFHTFAFYAIDLDGNVVPPVSFDATVIAPTATASHTPTQSFTPSPYPTHTPAPWNVRIEVPLSPQSFDILGDNGTHSIRSSYSGYTVRLRINGDFADINGGESVSVSDVTLSFKPSIISDNAALLAFKLVNRASEPRTVDVGIVSDVLFDGDEGAVVSVIQPGIGLVVSSPDNALTFLLRNSALVAPVSTFWFGRSSDHWDAIWNQTNLDFVDIIDSALAFSWQEIPLLPGQILTGSVIAKFGVHAPRDLHLSIEEDAIPGPLFHTTTITLHARVSSSDPTLTDVHLVLVVDDPLTVHRISGLGNYAVGVDFELRFRPIDYTIDEGQHELLFYAVDALGNLSPGRSVIVTIVAPTKGATSSISASHSPGPSISPRVNVPISVRNVSFADYLPHPSFDIFGTLGNDTVLTTYSGYFAGLRINDTTVLLEYLHPIELWTVTLSVEWRRISTNAIVLTVVVSNANAHEVVVDVGVTADINFDGRDDAPCTAIAGRRGFTVHSGTNALTFITARYPLVTDVSTFWFGWYYNRTNNGWAQVPEDSFSEGDSALSFTWQGIEIADGGVVKKSVIVRFGQFETNRVTLTLGVIPESVEIGKPLLITGSVRASGEPTDAGISLFLTIDGALDSLAQLSGAFTIVTPFTVPLVLGNYGVAIGPHRLSFYAVDADGDVSDEQTIGVTVQTESNQDGSATDVPEEKGSRTVVAIIGAIGGSGFIGGLFIALLCYGRKRDRQNAALGSGTASGTEPLKAYMADEILRS